MKTLAALISPLAAGLALQAAEPPLLSLSSNGQLTFTNASPGCLYTVEWASSLSNPDWSSGWAPLEAFAATNQMVTVGVPMLYRVACQTNLLVPTATGGSATYLTVGPSGPAGTFHTFFLGKVRLSSGKEYTMMEIDAGCGYKFLPCRSTETEFYIIPSDVSRDEGLEVRLAPSGTRWTNEWCDGSSDQITVLPNETISVPAGTFDCLTTEVREINNSLRLRSLSWYKCGFGMVQSVDFGNGSEPPVTNRLSSWTTGQVR